MWWLTGYAFAFGTGNGFIGFNPTGKWALESDPNADYALWFFEYAFAAASAAIISGSVAEHITHYGFILYCIFFTGMCMKFDAS
jgi:ammonium transporter, Amt family